MWRYRRESNMQKHAHLPPHERPGAFAVPGFRPSFSSESGSEYSESQSQEAVVGLDVQVVDERQRQERARQREERRQRILEEEQHLREMESRLHQLEQTPAVEATPIHQENYGNEPHSTTQTVYCKDRCRGAYPIALILLVVLAAIAVGIGLGVASGKRENQESVPPTSEPSPYYWNQLGQDIPGENSFDRFGSSVALSANGTILAAGARYNDGNGSNSGHVRVFEFNESDNLWKQLGKSIDGEAVNDYFGTSVALSADGTIVAAGARGNDGNGDSSGHVRVFEFDVLNKHWKQLGQNIDGEAAGDRFGTSVALSADGAIVAAGAELNDVNGDSSGHVRVFQFDVSNKHWKQLGQNIDGEAAGDRFGTSVALSADGTIMATGAELNDVNGDCSGHVRVFKFDVSNNHWKQLGQNIDGEAAGDRFGTAVALSVDGTIMAAGAKGHNGNGYNSGHVRLFEFNESSNRWNQLGQNIDGDATDDQFGLSVDLTEEGTVVCSGGKGYARVLQFDNENSRWNQLGNDTVNQGTFDCSVALSANGSISAIGGLLRNRGIVRIFGSEG